ncbi:uncharacterized protein [Solanum tuberosum]|uniref:uncharacterized protein n=1 Tax=Solanum tuberosum TaxID=4113 RepID=UPI00073A49A1|nr:PREDICTED: uncharacterized protein LOC107058185 [Solanum tuberosum]
MSTGDKSNAENREILSRAEAELKKYMYIEEEYWKQKSGMRWFKQGDKNTRFFHNYMKGRRKKLNITEIQNAQGDLVKTIDDIGAKAVLFFEGQFRENYRHDSDDMLKLIPKMITTEQNEEMGRIPSKEEIKEVVFSLNGESTGSPDGFSKTNIDMVWRLISNNWYSILVNERSYGFFWSPRGVKQGDPLLPTLFIIAAEVLARGLNKLLEDVDFKGYGLPKWSPSINHFPYADDTILFSSRERKSISKMMGVLREYEKISGQMINLNKSFFYLHDNTPLIVGIRLRRITGIRQGSFPFTYLGCPVYYERKKTSYFEEMIRKAQKRIMTWQNKWLSYGCRIILIANVLQSMPIYLLSAINPPKKITDQLHQVFTTFFWSKIGGERGKHWVVWKDISRAMFGKLWWKFRTSTSLWRTFMWNKYCKKVHPLIAKGTGASNTWKKMTEVREVIEHEIWWQVKSREASFWFDNWTKQGALYFTEDQASGEEELEIRQFITDGEWDRNKL